MKDTSLLPTGFGDLEPFLEWAIERREDRFRKRLISSMEKITGFYNAMVPRFDNAATYLKDKPINSLNSAEQRLLHMIFSVIEISRCVEKWDAPDNYAFGADKIKITL